MSASNPVHAITGIFIIMDTRSQVTGGAGWYQEVGQPAERLHSGDVIVTHDGVKHWRGDQG